MQLSQNDINILRSLPLTDVMRNNGHRIVRKSATQAYYLCPNKEHEDNDASFNVELSASDADRVCMYHCFGCDKMNGKGAIALQGELLGVDITGAGFITVAQRLVNDFHLHLEGIKDKGTTWSYTEPTREFTWHETEWTENHLRALGCSVMQRYNAPNEDGMAEATGDSAYGWAYVMNEDTGIYEQRAFDMNDISRVFGIYPVDEFVMPAKKMVDGTMRSYKNRVTDSYPVFVIKTVDNNGRWRVKKYEPYGRTDEKGKSYKWSWWYQGGQNMDKQYSGSLYGDCDVIDAIYNKDIVPQDTSVYRNHPVINSSYINADGEQVEQVRFKNVVICSGPRDAMQVYYHSDAHVVYPHSETAQISPVSIRRLLSISENLFILFDMDDTGRKEAIKLNMEYLKMRNIELPSDLSTLTGRRNGKPCKDVSDFFEQYWQIARHKASIRGKNINEIFLNIMQDAQPLMFWDRHVKEHRKNYDGPVKYVYELLPENVLQFLKASGMGIFKGKNAEEAPRFVRIVDNRLYFVKDEDVIKMAKTCMKEWLSNHARYNEPVLRSLISKSSQVISKNLLEELPIIDYNPIYWGTDYDFFFFSNGALKVTQDKTELIPYEELPFMVNADSILPKAYVQREPMFEITDNPYFDKYEQQHMERKGKLAPGDTHAHKDEDARWYREKKLWPYKLELKRPMNEMPSAFQFLYDTGRHYWKKEQEAKRNGVAKEKRLSAEQQQYQDMQFISKAAGIGYVLSRNRKEDIGRFAYIVDYSVDDEKKSQGGTGKSLIASLLKCVRHECHIDGKGWKTGDDMSGRNFVSYDYLKHGYINIEDLKKTVPCEALYTIANSDFNRKRLNKDEETIRGEYAAKMMVTSNAMFNQSEGSTRRRIWTMYVGDYYHEGDGIYTDRTSPYNKFGYLLGESSMPEDEYNDMVQMMIQFLQFYLRRRTYIEAPVGSYGKMRLLRNDPMFSQDKQFPEWASKLFEGDMFVGVPLPKIDLCISYFQYIGKEVTQSGIISYAKSTKFGQMLRTYCDAMNLTYNPDVVYKRKSETNRMPRCDAFTYEFNEQGLLTGRRVKMGSVSCYYFYRRGDEPASDSDVLFNQVTDPACEGYVTED